MLRKISLLTVAGALALSVAGWSNAADASLKARPAARPLGSAELKAVKPGLKPDLVIKSFGLKRWGACKPHSAVMTFEVTVANIGNAPSPSSAALGNKALVQVMENSGAGPWGNGAFLPAIPPGGSATADVPVYFLISNPGHMTADAPHKFSAVADPLKLVAEQNEYNNRSTPINTGAPRGCPGGGGGGGCKPAKPALAHTGTQPHSTPAGQFRKHNLVVRNWKSFCPEMFAPAPNLPPCGANANSSRSWVDIFDSQTNQRLYGFCALGSPQGLTQLWFATPVGKAPPRRVHIIVWDRQTNIKYVSNSVGITP